MAFLPDIEVAIEEIRQTFDGHQVDAVAEEQGGAYVTVRALFIGDQYVPTHTWVGFLIPFQYPRPDVYPHHIDPGVRRADGNPLGEAFHPNNSFNGQPSIMISRRSNNWDATTDTAALKLVKVLDWIRGR